MTAAFDPDALLQLWTRPMTPGPDAERAFRELYTDPVTVNGNALSAADLVDRAMALQAAIEHPDREVLDIADAGGKVAIAFRLTGRHVGPLATAAGVLPATGRTVSIRVIDILTVSDGRISEIIMVSDELGALSGIDAVRLVEPAGGQ
jgi:ketosteroid isomerase-like protein